MNKILLYLTHTESGVVFGRPVRCAQRARVPHIQREQLVIHRKKVRKVLFHALHAVVRVCVRDLLQKRLGQGVGEICASNNAGQGAEAEKRWAEWVVGGRKAWRDTMQKDETGIAKCLVMSSAKSISPSSSDSDGTRFHIQTLMYLSNRQHANVMMKGIRTALRKTTHIDGTTQSAAP